MASVDKIVVYARHTPRPTSSPAARPCLKPSLRARVATSPFLKDLNALGYQLDGLVRAVLKTAQPQLHVHFDNTTNLNLESQCKHAQHMERLVSARNKTASVASRRAAAADDAAVACDSEP